MHIYSYQSFKSHPLFTTAEFVDRSKSSRLSEGQHYVVLDAARHYSKPSASLYCILYVTQMETGHHLSISVSGRPEEAKCLAVVRDWPERTIAYVEVGLTKNGYPRLTQVTPIHPATPPRVGKSPTARGNSVGLRTAALMADFCFRREPGQSLRIPAIIQRGRPGYPLIMVVAARPSPQIWEDSLPFLLKGAPDLKESFVETLTDLASFNACAAQLPLFVQPYSAFQEAMAGHEVDVDFETPSKPCHELSIGERHGSLAPYPVLYTFLSPVPLGVGTKAARKLGPGGTLKVGQHVLRCIFRNFHPPIVLASGVEVWRALPKALRPIPHKARAYPLTNLPKQFGSQTGFTFIEQEYEGSTSRFLAVPDLRSFGRGFANRARLPTGYWERFCGILRSELATLSPPSSTRYSKEFKQQDHPGEVSLKEELGAEFTMSATPAAI